MLLATHLWLVWYWTIVCVAFVKSLSLSHAHQVVITLISSKLGCCNSLFHNIPEWYNAKLQQYSFSFLGGGPRVVVSTAAFHARVRGSVPGFGGLKETKSVSSPSTCESQYCGEPPWPRGSVLGLRPPGLEFRILCLEDSVISIISPSSGGSPGPV